MSDTVTLPMTPETFWGLVGLAAFLVMMIAVFGLLSGVKPEAGDTPFTRLRDRFGMAGLPEGVFALGLILWSVIFCALILGLLWTIISAAFHAPARTVESQTALRFVLISLTALTATLGAVVAFPVTLIRIALSRKQTETAEEALFNDKINAAAAGLAARRQVTRVINSGSDKESVVTEWEDDLVTRASAIDRLEGLANERPDITARVARMLSIYVRELSREHPAKEPPERGQETSVSEWAKQLRPIRPDMEKAAQALGRLQEIPDNNLKVGDIDLRGANLQGFDLKFLRFEGVRFDGSFIQGSSFLGASLNSASFHSVRGEHAELRAAYMQRANLWDSNFSGASFEQARLHFAILREVDFRGATFFAAGLKNATLEETNMHAVSLWGAELQGAILRRITLTNADLHDAQLQGAYILGVDLDELTDLREANFFGAAIRAVGPLVARRLQNEDILNHVFGHKYLAQVVEGNPPAHWARAALSLSEFTEQWHAWQDTLPDFDPSWRRN